MMNDDSVYPLWTHLRLQEAEHSRVKAEEFGSQSFYTISIRR